MNADREGSYNLEALNDPASELDRLKKQGELFKEMEVRTLRKCGLQQNDKVLELGCGPGFITKILSVLAKDGTLISVDNDPELLEMLSREEIQQPSGGFKAIQASADSLPIDDDWANFTYARFLLQHTPSPQSIISEALRCTKPGGIFCAVDSDDGLIIHYPKNDAIELFLQEAYNKQAARGGDRFIGRKLSSLFHQSGFINIRTSVTSLTTSDISPQALLDIVFGYKSSLLGNKETTSKFVDQLTQKAINGEFILSAGIFIVVGEKPSA